LNGPIVLVCGNPYIVYGLFPRVDMDAIVPVDCIADDLQTTVLGDFDSSL
jgi:hypothetical protein